LLFFDASLHFALHFASFWSSSLRTTQIPQTTRAEAAG